MSKIVYILKCLEKYPTSCNTFYEGKYQKDFK